MTRASLLAGSIPHPAGYRQITPSDAHRHLDELLLIDVREPDEFTGPLGRAPGAELVPLRTVLASAERWDKSRPLLLICRSGGRSGQAAAALAGMGFSAVYNLVGGMMAWNDAGLPVEGR